MNTWTNNTNVKKAQVHPLVLQRKRLGIKQQVLADLTGLGITKIKRAEYGDRISPYTVSAICNFFSERLKRQFQPEELFFASQWQEAEIDILNPPTAPEKNISVGLQKRMANHYQPLAPIESNDFFSFGNLDTKLIVLDGNGIEAYDPQNISTFYDPRPMTFSEDIQRVKSQIEEEQAQAKSDEKLLPWNGQIYHLANYQLSREPVHEHMKLNLWFRPTDYFTVLAKNRYLRDTKSQDKYLTDDLNISSFDIPIPFGVGLSVITNDGYIIFAQREGNLGVRPGYFMTSVEEGLSRPVDRGTISDAPDLYRCACRGLSEELGLMEKRDFSVSDIQFLGLGLDTELFMCGMRGLLKLQLDARTIIKNWETGVKDKMENRRLLAIPFTLESVCDFVLNHSPWGGGALMGIYHTLVHEFGKEQTNTAITSYCTAMSTGKIIKEAHQEEIFNTTKKNIERDYSFGELRTPIKNWLLDKYPNSQIWYNKGGLEIKTANQDFLDVYIYSCSSYTKELEDIIVDGFFFNPSRDSFSHTMAFLVFRDTEKAKEAAKQISSIREGVFTPGVDILIGVFADEFTFVPIANINTDLP